MDAPDPPPKKYDLKERQFKRENIPGAAVPTAKELAMISGQRAPTGPKLTVGPKPGDPNDVHVVLQQNRAVEQKLGLNELQIKEIKSRRKRDFLLMLLGGNLLIVTLIIITGFNVISVIFGFAGIVIFSLALTWIMWQVMGKY